MRVLLVTSRETRRWVVPKGNPIRGLAPHEAAANEAFEEGGATGIACPNALGTYTYVKRRKDGTLRSTKVDLYPLAVTDITEDFPEQDERETRWFRLPDAADAVEEAELKALIRAFRAPDLPVGSATRALEKVRTHSARRFPIVRWFQALMPTSGRFFELFEQHGALLVAGADALARLLQGGPDMDQRIREIHDREEQADDVTRQVFHDVRRIFVTPFDRSAITGLIGVMDDAIDQMNATAKTIALYGVTSFEPQMRDMSGIIVDAARVTAEALPLLRAVGPNGSRLHTLTERLVQMEGHADDIHDAGLRALFLEKGQQDTMGFIVGRELYSHLERIVDRFEDVANEIQGLVIDHT